MKLLRHWKLLLWTLFALVVVAELPGWMLWSPLALWVGLLVVCALRLPRFVAPSIGIAGLAVAGLLGLRPEPLAFGVSVTLGALMLGSATRARIRPGLAVILASMPIAIWVAAFYAGTAHVASEAAFRAAWTQEIARRLPFDARMGLSRVMFDELVKRSTEMTVLLLPSFSLAQAPVLMAWGYALAGILLEESVLALETLPGFTRVRLPDGAVWMLCLGLLLLVTRQTTVLRAGANLSVLMAMAYFLQGCSVLTFMATALQASFLVWGARLLIAVLLLSPLFSVFTCILGLSDVWLDFRRLGKPAGDLDS